jgi:hypothetical protein
MRRGVAIQHRHRLSWLVGRLGVELVLSAALIAGGALVAAQSSLAWLAAAVVPFTFAVRSLWRGWWLGAAVVAELRWRAILARLLRQSRHPRPR